MEALFLELTVPAGRRRFRSEEFCSRKFIPDWEKTGF